MLRCFFVLPLDHCARKRDLVVGRVNAAGVDLININSIIFSVKADAVATYDSKRDNGLA